VEDVVRDYIDAIAPEHRPLFAASTDGSATSATSTN
jgi:hypothetical protein